MSAKKIHLTMVRAYQAAISQKLISGENNQTEFAGLINASPQKVNNWESRGISKEGRLKLQQDHGVNATWVETGAGEMLVSTPINAYVFTKQDSLAILASPQKNVCVFPSTVTLQTLRERQIAELVDLAKSMSDEGMSIAIYEAKKIAEQYPAQAKQTQESSE